ncbi:MAG: hypothetical protein WAK04_08450 [Xanthobacteraceae bacterium]
MRGLRCVFAMVMAASIFILCEGNSHSDGVVVIGEVFIEPGKDGDFSWMIQQLQYRDVLFIFNDNEQQFKAHQDNPNAAKGCSAGGGNAVIRPYQCLIPPRAAGIPTGPNYKSLTPDAKDNIDEAINTIKSIVAREHYRRIMYSARDTSGALGTQIFSPGDDVKEYIVRQLRAIR